MSNLFQQRGKHQRLIAQLVLRALPEEEEEEEERKISVSAENSRINNSQKDSSNLKVNIISKRLLMNS